MDHLLHARHKEGRQQRIEYIKSLPFWRLQPCIAVVVHATIIWATNQKESEYTNTKPRSEP